MDKYQAAVKKFEKEGPFTCAEALRVAKFIAGEDCQIGDFLRVKLHLFSPEDIKLMLTLKTFLSPEDFEKWNEGTEDWNTCVRIYKELSEEQLQVISENLTSDGWDYVVQDVSPETWRREDRVKLLRLLREQDERDKSPVRKLK
jgi:hypothetical protein